MFFGQGLKLGKVKLPNDLWLIHPKPNPFTYNIYLLPTNEVNNSCRQKNQVMNIFLFLGTTKQLIHHWRGVATIFQGRFFSFYICCKQKVMKSMHSVFAICYLPFAVSQSFTNKLTKYQKKSCTQDNNSIKGTAKENFILVTKLFFIMGEIHFHTFIFTLSH